MLTLPALALQHINRKDKYGHSTIKKNSRCNRRDPATGEERHGTTNQERKMSIVWNTGAAAMRFRLKNKKKKRIKHNDLTHYFLRPREELPRAYLASCEKFFRSIQDRLITKKDAAFLFKLQAASTKRQASSAKLQAP